MGLPELLARLVQVVLPAKAASAVTGEAVVPVVLLAPVVLAALLVWAD